MKFQRLDTRHGNTQRDPSTDVYQYLDDLLDKTFLTDYFLDRSSDAAAAAAAAP